MNRAKAVENEPSTQTVASAPRRARADDQLSRRKRNAQGDESNAKGLHAVNQREHDKPPIAKSGANLLAEPHGLHWIGIAMPQRGKSSNPDRGDYNRRVNRHCHGV